MPSSTTRSLRHRQTPPRLDRWPEAVRSAELMRGSVVRCGPGLRLTSWPDTPSVRAAALRPRLHEGRIAALLTAAWIWGAARHTGDFLDFISVTGRPSYAHYDEGIRLHRFVLHDGDTEELAGLQVTTPIRTIIDLLRRERFGSDERAACRVLLAGLTNSRERVAQHLTRRRGAHPHTRLARERLEQAL